MDNAVRECISLFCSFSDILRRQSPASFDYRGERSCFATLDRGSNVGGGNLCQATSTRPSFDRTCLVVSDRPRRGEPDVPDFTSLARGTVEERSVDDHTST